MRALDFDQAVMMTGAHEDTEQAARARRNAEVLRQNNATRKALGLPLDTAPLA